MGLMEKILILMSFVALAKGDDLSSRMLGGIDALTYPSSIALLVDNSSKVMCTGVFISPGIVSTSGECALNKKAVGVLPYPAAGPIAPIIARLVGPNFDFYKATGNQGLVVLVPKTSIVDLIIGLIQLNPSLTPAVAGTPVNIYTMDQTSFPTKILLQKVSSNVTTTTDCQTALKITLLPADVFCTYSSTSSMCSLESGASIFDGNNKYLGHTTSDSACGWDVPDADLNFISGISWIVTTLIQNKYVA